MRSDVYVRSYGIFLNGVRCDAKHSSLVHGSGNAYCGAVRPTTTKNFGSESSNSSSSDSDSSSSPGKFPDLTAQTLLLFQPVRISNSSKNAMVCWDKGSTRCLVTHSFARACGMRSQPVVFRLSVVGEKGEVEEGVYYEFELQRNDSSIRKVWAFGVDHIMEGSYGVPWLSGLDHVEYHG